MSYDFTPPAQVYSHPKQKPKKLPRILAFILISLVIQLSFFYGLNNFFHQLSGTDIEPKIVTEVHERNLSLSPAPFSPEKMAISPDRSRLALSDTEHLRIYDLKSGAELLYYPLSGRTLGSMQWLPDRNRLLFTLLDTKQVSEVIKPPENQHKSKVMDEVYSSDSYRDPETRTTTKEGFEIAVFSLEGTTGASPELVQTLRETGPMPEVVDVNVSTYTNLLFVHWKQLNRDHLAQIDIMNRIKDYRLPKGKLTKLVVTPRSGTLWAELSNDNTPEIYMYQKGRWKLQTYLDGYSLLGVTPDDQLVVAAELDNQTKEVFLVNENGDFKSGWTFTDPILIEKVSVLNDGRLLYLDDDRVVIHTLKRGEGTLFNAGKVDGYSPDGKMVVSWQPDDNQLKIFEEVVQEKKEK